MTNLELYTIYAFDAGSGGAVQLLFSFIHIRIKMSLGAKSMTNNESVKLKKKSTIKYEQIMIFFSKFKKCFT